jgi:hypothetical protein
MDPSIDCSTIAIVEIVDDTVFPETGVTIHTENSLIVIVTLSQECTNLLLERLSGNYCPAFVWYQTSCIITRSYILYPTQAPHVINFPQQTD